MVPTIVTLEKHYFPLCLCSVLLFVACENQLDTGSGVAPSGGYMPSTQTTASSVGGSSSAATNANTSSNSGSGGGSGGGITIPKSEQALAEFTRLTRAEYHATVSAALGVEPDPGLLPEDGRVGPFTSNLLVTPDPVHPYLLLAEELAAEAVADNLPTCEDGSVDECFADSYQAAFEQLFRRPLSDEERSTWTGVAQAVLDGGGTGLDATRAMVATALVSPDFLYRSTPSASGANGQARQLAERLSFALWDEPPDTELRETAESGLSDLGAALASEGARLVSDDRATAILARFFGQWLGVDTDLRLENEEFVDSPDYLELLAFVRDAVNENTSVTDFISGRRGFVHPDNADTYGVEVDGGGDVELVEWPTASPRRGLVTQELFAGATRHPDNSRRPIFRGVLVQESLLCNKLPVPDAALVALAGEVGDRTVDDRCSGCHLHIDPIGRAFAVLDPDFDGETPDAEVLAHQELAGTYDNLGTLLEAIAGSRAFAECFARHWLGFFLERPLEEADDAWLASLADAVQGGASLGGVVEQSILELGQRSENTTPWCEGN